ncbi:LytTR family DNA-binding domain-containing protein [Ruminococcaceae bacterium OttesenSCG-928-L11]|nr:LytTR family DNA-binding domain-containing protein [Ruminococcaceae bacterium OttesenSCG-928-L11]
MIPILNIAICEDLPGDMAALAQLLREYCDTMQLDTVIDCFESAEKLLEAFQPGKYQIAFLDVIMDGMTGMEAAQTIRRRDEEIAIIFITISPDFAVDSYLINATFYMVKPVSASGLAMAMERCRPLLAQRVKFLRFTQNRRTVAIRHKDILFLETQRNDRIIYTIDGEFRIRTSLDTLEQELGGVPFVRCHNSFLVNLRWVVDINGRDFVLQDNRRIPISKAYLASAQEQFDKYMFDEARGKIH